jgi:predicted ester cyclase
MKSTTLNKDHQIPPSDLENLISTLDVKFVGLSHCSVSTGYRLELGDAGAPGIHYNLSGKGKIFIKNHQPIELKPHTLIIVPRNTPFRIEVVDEKDRKIRINASTFHKNFSAGEFEKNGPLVTENIYVNSNNTILIGRKNFVRRIERYKIPFPGLQMKDRIVLVDGNMASVHYILQGNQSGPFGKIPAAGNKVEGMSAEFFVMNNDAIMTNLLTITQLDKLEEQSRGDKKIENFQNGCLVGCKKREFCN